MAPHRHLIVDVTVTSARTSTNVPRIGVGLPLPGSLALGAHHGKLDADLRTSALLGTPSVKSIHDYHPFALEDGGRLAPMAVKLVDRLAILVVVRRFHGMGVDDSRSFHGMGDVRVMSVCNISFIEHYVFLFGVLGKMCDVNLCNVFLRLFMALWAPICMTLLRRAMLTLWFFPLSSFCLVASIVVSCKICYALCVNSYADTSNARGPARVRVCYRCYG
jgi:hypothetical protein